MLTTRYRRPYAVLAAAIIFAAAVTGCGWFTGSGSESTTTPPPDPLASLRLDQFWDLGNYGCLPTTEADVPQPTLVASLVKVCYQRPTVYRLLNTSTTSVRVTYWPPVTTVRWSGAHAPDGRITTEMLTRMNAGKTEGYGWLVLPAGDSAMVTLKEAGSGMPGVASDPEHGGLAFHARMVGKLVEGLPWDKIGELDGIAAKAVACVFGALALVESREAAIHDAIETADKCREMFEEISERWERRAAKVAPKAPALGSRFAVLARPATPVATGIKGFATSVAELAFRRF